MTPYLALAYAATDSANAAGQAVGRILVLAVIVLLVVGIVVLIRRRR